MLPDPLKSVWREYKQDTDSVASWLASTAKARGFTAGLLTPIAAPKKKKKRTQKRVPTKYIVAIKDFVPLAKFIADCENPVVDVPASFVTTINRVIDVRSSFSNQLIEHGVKIEKKVPKHSRSLYWDSQASPGSSAAPDANRYRNMARVKLFFLC